MTKLYEKIHIILISMSKIQRKVSEKFYKADREEWQKEIVFVAEKLYFAGKINIKWKKMVSLKSKKMG